MMKFIRKHKKLSIIGILSLAVFLVISVAYGRYIRNVIYDFLLETRAFYFNSSILSSSGKNYLIENWDGVNTYPLTIDLTNRKNDRRVTTTDITYDVVVSCPDTVQCSLSKDSDTIHPEDEIDTFQVFVNPIQNFYEGDSVAVTITVTSSLPYVKTMSATYTIGVERSNFTYEIIDSSGSKYLKVNLVNSISYYEVETAFEGHAVGDKVSLEEYATLSADDRKKCFSAIVTLTYDPSVLEVDMSDINYVNRLTSNYEEQTINGFQYVSKFSFKVDASSSSSVLFYKDVVSKNYTYPIVNPNSVVQVSVKKAN